MVISNKEIEDIMRIVESLKESGLMIKGITEAIKNDAKEQKAVFLGMLLGRLATSLLENMLTGKGTIETDEGTFRAGQGL